MADNYRTSHGEPPASRCRSAALCKRKAVSLAHRWPICSRSYGTMRMTPHPPLVLILTWLTDHAGGVAKDYNAQAGVCKCVRACLRAHACVCVYAAERDQSSPRRHGKSQCLDCSSISAMWSPLLCAASLNFLQSASHPCAHRSHHAAARRCAAVPPPLT